MMSDYANVPAEPVNRPKLGVGGFLLYFCIALTFFGPAKMVQTIVDSSSRIISGIYGMLALTSFLAGVATWATLNSAFIFIRIHIGARILYAIFQIWIVMRLLQRQADAGEEVIAIAVNIAGILLLFLYFRLSTRVDETFGRNI
jgi:hypothetical protein